MNILAVSLIIASVILGVGRNILSKTISGISPKIATFYLMQGIIFSSGGVILACYPDTFKSISTQTAILAFIYGLLLITAQWNFTSALSTGNTSVCVTVYSMGFVLPTLSGMFFWGEEISFLKIIGIILAAATVIVSGGGKKEKSDSKKYLIPLILSMLASGGLGILQKIHQSSPHPEEKSAFIFLAFVLAAAFSFGRIMFCKEKRIKILKIHIISAALVGICFSACNLLNTILAGLLETAVLFPVLNISSIFAAMIFCLIFFREKLTAGNYLVLGLGTGAILLINL